MAGTSEQRPDKMPESSDAVVIDIPTKIRMSMENSIKTFARNYKQNGVCTIHKVFHSVRNKHQDDYTPKVIAIGPFHHDNPAFKPMEELKWTYLRSLTNKNTKNTLDTYINLILTYKKWVRSFYSELVVEDDDAFVELMVLDGCFLIEHLVKAYCGDHEPRLSHVKWNLPLLRHDLLLLENQYPLPVLQALFDVSDIPILKQLKPIGPPVTLMNLIVSFVTRNAMETLPEANNQEESSKPKRKNHLRACMNLVVSFVTKKATETSPGKPKPEAKDQEKSSKPIRKNHLRAIINLIVSFVPKKATEISPEEPKSEEPKSEEPKPKAKNQEESSKPVINHLLHAYHASLRLPPSSSQAKSGGIRGKLVRSGSAINATIFFILSCFCCRLHFPWNFWRSSKNDPKKKEKAPRTIPTATQLQDCGITFKKKKIENKSTLLNMLDVSFHEDSGIIEMSELPIQENTPSLLRNLIAFEQCTPASGAYFTSHATFMNNLIDKAEDVAVLKESHVIESKLSKDEEVADLFNHLCDGAYLNFDDHHHIQIFKDVTKYCDVAHHKWRASLCRDYFGNPWAIMSILAAIFLLLLTVLQSVYTVYAYYRPRN